MIRKARGRHNLNKVLLEALTKEMAKHLDWNLKKSAIGTATAYLLALMSYTLRASAIGESWHFLETLDKKSVSFTTSCFQIYTTFLLACKVKMTCILGLSLLQR